MNCVVRAKWYISFLSDIVFVRTWYPVSIPKFYNPVTSLLKPAGEKDSWKGMRTTGQLRHDQGIKLKQNKDSLYKVYLIWVLLLCFFFFFLNQCSHSDLPCGLELCKHKGKHIFISYLNINNLVFLSTDIQSYLARERNESVESKCCLSMRVYKSSLNSKVGGEVFM